MLSIYITLTALTVQFFYILVNWYYFRRDEYVYYSIYVVIISVYFLNKYLGDEMGIIQIGSFSFSELYADKILAVLSYIFYFKFGRRFVEAETRYPSINKLMKSAEIFLFIYIIVNIFILALTGFSDLENILFLPINISIFIVLIYVFGTMIKKKEVLDKFILFGSMFYGISAVMTLVGGIGKPVFYDNHILYLQIGAFVEMIFLNAGLIYKSRMLQNQTVNSQSMLIEKYKENEELSKRLETIRGNISRDLHDDVGATLSSIKAYAEILKLNPKDLIIADLISSNSSEMIESLEVISWSTNPDYDNFKSLINMLQKYSVQLCRAKNIKYSIDYGDIDLQMQLPGEIRQNIFLILKESINNMIKYSDADTCKVTMNNKEKHFFLQVADNGKGFVTELKKAGHGLQNIQKRVDNLHGSLTIQSAAGKGTTISVSFPFPFLLPDLWDMKEH